MLVQMLVLVDSVSTMLVLCVWLWLVPASLAAWSGPAAVDDTKPSVGLVLTSYFTLFLFFSSDYYNNNNYYRRFHSDADWSAQFYSHHIFFLTIFCSQYDMANYIAYTIF